MTTTHNDNDDDVRWIECESMQGPVKRPVGDQDGVDGDGANADDDDEDDDSPDVGDLFADPDPLDTFHFEWTLPATASTVKITLSGHKAELGQTLHSTGLTLWRASELLCDYMIRNSCHIAKKNVLELGAGLGLCGILAHHLQAANVVLTDGDTDALSFMRSNVASNCGDSSSANSSSNSIQCRQLVWGNKERLSDLVRQHTTPSDADNENKNEGFHLILGSDIIYVEEILDPLFESVERLLAVNGRFWLAYARRNVKIDLVLETAARHGFSFEEPKDAEGVFIFQRIQQEEPELNE
jgi:predicted nicotinamide N-methyase